MCKDFVIFWSFELFLKTYLNFIGKLDTIPLRNCSVPKIEIHGDTIFLQICLLKQPSPSKYPLTKCLIRDLFLKIEMLGNLRSKDLFGTHPKLFNVFHKCVKFIQMIYIFFR